MAQYSALRCVSCIWQNNEEPLISNGLRFIVTNLPTAALWVLFHLARHSFATNQLTEGTDLYIISKMMGHTDIRTTQIYTKVVDPKKEQAADAIKLDLKSDVI